MVEYKEVEITRILNPTAIDLGEYVINPYKGCEYACLYCYVRFNKVTAKEKRTWGSYVDIRVNAPQLLEKELKLKKPRCVLLGSTCECFQPAESKYGISRAILEILNHNQIHYSILTRSPDILNYLELLKAGFCKTIYFTINDFRPEVKSLLEPKSPAFSERIKAIRLLLEEKLAVIPYFSPILPWVSAYRNIFSLFPNAASLEFEGINFSLGNIQGIIEAIGRLYPQLKAGYERLAQERNYYERFWQTVKKDILKEAIKKKKNQAVYIHKFGHFFENSYRA